MANIPNQFDTATLVLKDGTAVTPLEVTAQFVQGDYSLSGLSAELADVSVYQTRRVLHSLRKGARTFPTLSFSSMFSEFTEATLGNIVDMITAKAGTPYADRVSTTADKGDVLTLNAELTIDGETTNLGDVHFMFDFSEGDPNSLSFTSTIYGTIDGALAIAAS